jgi:hypothetical protein
MDGQINAGIGNFIKSVQLLGIVGGPYNIAGSKYAYFKDSSVWAKSIFVGHVARGFPAKDDVVNEIILPAL